MGQTLLQLLMGRQLRRERGVPEPSRACLWRAAFSANSPRTSLLRLPFTMALGTLLHFMPMNWTVCREDLFFSYMSSYVLSFSPPSPVFSTLRCSRLSLRNTRKARTLRRPRPWRGNVGLCWKEATAYPEGVTFRAKRKLKPLQAPF